MTWRHLDVAPSVSHHLRDGEPAYADRFDEVLKFHAPGLAPVRRSGEAWHIHADGRPAYERRFQRTFGFYEGLAAVAGDDGWHHIDPTGADVYPQRFSWCGNFQGGRCTVRAHDGRYHHIGSTGEPAYDPRWRYAGDFRDGVAVVQAEDGRSTHIDLAGRLSHGRWFMDLDVFHKAFARARDEAGWTHVDTSGKPIYARRFAAVEPFYNGQARVERLDGGLEVIDEHGQVLVELRRGRFGPPSENPVRKLLLIGLPGAGKTTVGDLCAEQMGLPVHRLDDFRRSLADATVAGDYVARAAFLSACTAPEEGLYEFSASGFHRIAVRQAFREARSTLLTVWVDTRSEVRGERLATRTTTVPLPDWGIPPGAFADAMEEKLRADFDSGFWEFAPGWRALRVDGGQPPDVTAQIIRTAWKSIGGPT